MTTASKRKGTAWETEIVNFLRGLDYEADRLRLSGVEDEGDVAVKDGDHVCVVEAKAEKSIDLAGYVDEAVREARNYEKHRGLREGSVLPVAFVKRRNKSVRDAYVVIPAYRFFE